MRRSATPRPCQAMADPMWTAGRGFHSPRAALVAAPFPREGGRMLSRHHRLVLAGALVLSVPLPAMAGSHVVDAAGRGEQPAPVVVGYAAPLPEPLDVLRGFDAPSGPYAAGHRGVDLATRPGEPVRAAADGVVTFAGPVAGRGVVAIAHPDGVSTEYEPLSPAVTAGETVARGAVVGTVTGTHGDCPPGSCLHWGARRGSDYFDPLSLLQALGPVRLLPWGPS